MTSSAIDRSQENYPGDPWKLNEPPLLDPKVRPPFHEAQALLQPPVAEHSTKTTHEISLPLDIRSARLRQVDAPLPTRWRVIGQIFGSFFIIETENRLLLLDQHTTHERVLYEKLTGRYREGRVETQQLLFPEEIELSGRDAALMERWKGDMGALGIDIESFGDRVYALRAVPALLKGNSWRSLILDILDRAADSGEMTSFDALAEGAINIMACRGAVKAGDMLRPEEIEELVTQLQSCILPYTCPHGRPVAFAIERESILKDFLRK